MLEPI